MVTSNIKAYFKRLGIKDAVLDRILIREIPKDNLYWEKANKYIEPKIRFIFIPFLYELFYSYSGLPIETVLEESSIQTLETILHYSELEEQKLMTFDETVQATLELERIKESLSQNPLSKKMATEMMLNYPQYESLRRGNFIFFYFTIFYNDGKIEQLKESIMLLADLLICGCVLDDLYDAQEDKLSGEVNILNELGGDYQALGKAKKVFDHSNARLAMYFPELEKELEKLFYQCTLKFLSKKTQVVS